MAAGLLMGGLNPLPDDALENCQNNLNCTSTKRTMGTSPFLS